MWYKLVMKLKNTLIYGTYYGVRILLAIAMILFAVNQDWISLLNTTLILLLIMSPSILKKKYNFFFPIGLDALTSVFVFISLFLGSVQDYYERFPLLDGILHFKSGILLGVFGFIFVYLLNSDKENKVYIKPLFISFFVVSFSMGLSVLWEIYEYTIDTVWGFKTQESGLPDTMGDLITNTIGAIIVSVFGYMSMRKNYKIPFTPGELE